MAFLNTILEVFYPPQCMLCRQILGKEDGAYLCRLCEARIQDEVESRAGVEGEETKKAVVALFPYEGIYRKAILRWKYGGVRKYARGFAALLVQKGVFKEIDAMLLIPIPAAASRLRKRGFNQSLDLAIEVGKLTGIQVLDCLKRSKDTRPQAECTREERYSNIRGKMTMEKYSGQDIKSIVLIDDIYTTGSTIREAVRVIRKEYAFREAVIWTVVIGKGKF